MARQLLKSDTQWFAYLSDEERTAHPYMTEVWGDGHCNHPFIDLVAQPDAIAQLPEVVEFPALALLLAAANGTNDLLMTTACHPGTCEHPPTPEGFTRSAGALVYLALRDEARNKDPQTLIALARELVQAIDWAQVPDLRLLLTIEPYKSWRDRPGYYGLAFEFHALANDNVEAWGKAAAYSPVLAAAIAAVR